MMTHEELFDQIYFIPKVRSEDFVKNFEIFNKANFFEYVFLSGPFVGSRFRCTAPSIRLMKLVPYFTLEFISGPCKGIITRSLLTYDQDVRLISDWKKYV
ncbi:hypothetical protein VR20_116 [Escherichia phage vB_EcoM_VR20]|uniref:Uncharacterized protein n=1 Tax=Escherichia phage vB_EcoM_VR20 TaxID=1567027 RepID=A0A0A7HFX8_9CAUD|nr:hypothetical protein AVV68_gp116 [Escherichia phage vB_EcoM_VR20]AIZ02174.1 hypothetical protein VR20_116 [Escherichia phage vB_EcoM_VR20]